MFFYLKRDLKEPEIEPVGMKRYMLVRVGLNAGREEWFGLKLGKEEFAPEDSRERDGSVFGDVQGKTEKELYGPEGREERLAAGLFGRIRAACSRRRNGRLEEKKRQAERQEKERLLAERELRAGRTEEALRKLAAELSDMADEPGKCYCVYESGVRKAVMAEGNGKDAVLPFLWHKYLEWGEFRDYGKVFWTERLFSKSLWNHYVILGTAPCIYGLIEKYARNMKSLRWILAEADYSQEVLDFVEDFYIEYGLAIDLQTFEGCGSGRRFALSCQEPSNIIDFTEDILFECQGAAEGSVWLDVFSVEEKKRRLLARNPGIRYFSMKEEWKRAQRRCRTPRTGG